MRWLVLAVACTVTLCLTGCAPHPALIAGSPAYTARSPAASFSSTGCPSGLGDAQDVAAPTHPDDRLLNPDLTPSSGIVCEYGSVFNQGPGPLHTLAKEIDLSNTSASELATAAADIDLSAPAGSASCPDDDGRVTVITFDYSHATPAHLWWHDTGCQSIDNGNVQAEQIANDSFGHFQTVFTAVTRSTR